MTNEKAQMSSLIFGFLIFDFIYHLDFDIWISKTGAVFT